MQVISFERSIDQLETQLISMAERSNAMEYELLELVREYEIRHGYRLWMLNSTAEWLNLKCGISLGAAREKVRVAMALFDKPIWSKAFKQGRLSYSKARAMTRVPGADEQELLDEALRRSASQVETYCKRLRNADRVASTRDANRAHASRWLSCSKDANGMVHVMADLPEEAGLLVMKALEMAVNVLGREQAGEEDSFFARQADALVDMAKTYLVGERYGRRSDQYQVVVHVDESALKGEGGYTLAKDSDSNFFVRTTHRKVLSLGPVNPSRDGCTGGYEAEANPSRDGFVRELVPLYRINNAR